MGIGQYKPRERRYIVEWAEHRFPGCEKRFNVPLGPVPSSLVEEVGLTKALKVFRPWRPDVDAVIICPDKLIIAEAEILRPKDAIGDLLVYRDLVPDTPELKQFLDRPLEAWLVVPWSVTWVKEACDKYKIKLDLFVPDWIKDYLEELHKYFTAEGRQKREERRKALEGLGY